MDLFGRKRRRDEQVGVALAVFQANPDSEFYALDLMRLEGISSWHIYTVLILLHEKGLIESRWADKEPDAKHRRRLYRLAQPVKEAA